MVVMVVLVVVFSIYQFLRDPSLLVCRVSVGSSVVSVPQNAYEKHKTVVAAQGCKIIAKDLEKSLAGLPMFIAHQPDEIEVYRVRYCLIVLGLTVMISLHVWFHFYHLALPLEALQSSPSVCPSICFHSVFRTD